MNNTIKWCLSVIGGGVAAFAGEYGLFIALVAVVVVLDVLTGLVKAKATGEGLSSKKANRGFWKKLALFVGLSFGIFLDYAAATVLVRAGVEVSVDMPFALIFCAYIIINESISICENLVIINPDILPKWIVDLLEVGRDKLNKK